MFRFLKAIAAAFSAVTQTGALIAITWSSNTPTAGVTQTIADGTVPTVAELGQYVQNINTQHDKDVVDIAAINAQQVVLAAEIAQLRLVLKEGN